MNAIESLSAIERTVKLQKLNGSTFVHDVVGLPEFLSLVQDKFGKVIGTEGQMHPAIKRYAPVVWMCCIARGKSYFGFTAEEAAYAAICAGEN